jgi:uncharacterized membrane protein HdeD (DUF308 family)
MRRSDRVTGTSGPRRKRSPLRVFKVVAALSIAAVIFVVSVVAVVTVLLWLVLGATVWLVGVAAAIARPDAGRRLRSMGLHLLRSGPSRWLVKAAMHRARRAWYRERPAHNA